MYEKTDIKSQKKSGGVQKYSKILISFLIASIIIFSCSKNTDIGEQEQKPEQKPTETKYTFYTQKLGNENGYTLYNWFNNAQDTPGHTNDFFVQRYEAYIKGLVEQYEKQSDENTKQYLKPAFDIIKQNNYTYNNIADTAKSNYNAFSYVLQDYVRMLPDEDKQYEFYCSFETLAAEAYKYGTDLGKDMMTDSMDDSYQFKKQGLINLLENYMTTDVRKDIENNNCTEVVKMFNQTSQIATENLKEQQNINLDNIALINIMLPSKVMQHFSDWKSHNQKCVIDTNLDWELNDAAIYGRYTNY